MFRDRAVWLQAARVALGEAVCVGLMLGVYALLGRFSGRVLAGGLLGGFLASLNFLVMSLMISRAADRAVASGETARAGLSIQAGAVIRLLALAGVYIFILRKDFCDPVAAVLPLIFIRISIFMLELFRKDGETS